MTSTLQKSQKSLNGGSGRNKKPYQKDVLLHLWEGLDRLIRRHPLSPTQARCLMRYLEIWYLTYRNPLSQTSSTSQCTSYGKPVPGSSGTNKVMILSLRVALPNGLKLSLIHISEPTRLLSISYAV